VVEAVGNDRLRVRLENGHFLNVQAPAAGIDRGHPGARGLAELSPDGREGWRFVPRFELKPEISWPRKM